MKFEDLENNVRKDDNIIKRHRTDVRKPKLTLKHLNKLRKLRELKNLELLTQSKQLELIYGTQTEDEGF